MGHSSLLGIDTAPPKTAGTDEAALGRSDSTDSGSDLVGSEDLPSADPSEPVDVTLGRDVARSPIEKDDEDGDDDLATDISIDRVFSPEEERIEGVDSAEVLDKGMADDAPPKKRKTLTRESIRAGKP